MKNTTHPRRWEPVFTRGRVCGRIEKKAGVALIEKKKGETYPNDLTDEQREEITPLYTGMQNSTWSKRELTNGVDPHSDPRDETSGKRTDILHPPVFAAFGFLFLF